MLSYRIIGWTAAFAIASVVDWLVWNGHHWPLILGVFAIPSFEWVSRAFLALCTDQPRDPDEERLLVRLDQRACELRQWWRRRLVDARRNLRALVGYHAASP